MTSRKMNRSARSSRRDAEGASVGDEVVVQTGTSSPTTGSGAGDGPCPAFKKFLECDLVVDQLLQYLNFEEVKKFSSLSKDTLSAVRRSREFGKRSQLNMNSCLVSCGVDLKNLCPYLCKRISFDVSLPKRVVTLVADKLREVQSLFLYHGPREESKARIYSLNPNLINHCRLRIQEILMNTKNLRELQLGITFLKYPLDKVFSSKKVQQSIRNLESLIILNRHREYLVTLTDFLQFQQNMMLFSSCPGLKLKKFKMEYIDEDNVDSISTLIKGSRETLEELELGRDTWRLPEMALIQCEKLQRLAANVDEDDFEVFTAFVQLQPRLEELCLVVYTSIPAECLRLLEGRLPKVRKFRFSCVTPLNHTYTTRGNATGPVIWNFLKTMTDLEHFDVALLWDGRGVQMVESLPDNVRKLTISSRGRHGYIWFADWFARDIFSPITGDHLRRLKYLTHLSLFDCDDPFFNKVLQAIIKNCQNLKELRIGKCSSLHDFGISGVSDASNPEPGVPLSDLKGLIRLEISASRLGRACLLNVIRFQFLRWFSFDTDPGPMIHDARRFAAQLFEQNPKLLSFRHNGNSWGRNGLVGNPSPDLDVPILICLD